jgi:serine/threonine protein kinase
MGEVYRARDPRLGRDVAIKLIQETFAADQDRVHRFAQEARAAGQINHPNILAVYDVGTYAGVPYIVSELLEGHSLRALVLPGGVPVRTVLVWARQIAEGLAAAHAKGIVHRDLKPDNLFLTHDQRIKILDFGVAKLVAPTDVPDAATLLPTQTVDAMLVGTVGYMSPEQARGERVDPRSDLFAFGSVLYELLTGRPAFIRATAAETIAAVLKEDPPDSPGLSASPMLARIVSRCLEKTREARFQSARDLAFALGALSDTGESATAVPVMPPARRKSVTAGAAVVVTLGLVISLVSWLTRDDPRTSIETLLAKAAVTPVTNFEGSEEDAAISPDGRFIAFLADRGGPFHIWLSQLDTGRLDDLTPRAGDQRNPGLLRSVGFSGDGSEVWFGSGLKVRMRLMPLLGGETRAFLEEHAVNVAWSHDGKRLVYFTFDSGDPLKIADSSGGNPRQIWVDPKGDHNHFPAWSMDDKWIYFAHGSQADAAYDVWRIPSQGGSPERLTHLNRYVGYITPIDGRTLLYVAPDEDESGPWLWALDAERKTTRRVSGGLERYLSIAASGDGRRLVASVANPTAAGLWQVPILDRIAEESEVKPYPVGNSRALAPRFGKASLFYLSSHGAKDGLWRLLDGTSRELWKGSDGALLAPPAVSPHDDLVAIAPIERDGRRLTVVSADGAGHRSLSEAVDVRGASTWSPDAKSIVTGGNDAKGPGLFLVPVDGGEPRRVVDGPAFNPVWSPTEDLILYSGRQRALAPLLAVRSDGSPVDFPVIQIAFGGGGRVRFLPNGKGVVFMEGPVGEPDFWLLDLATKKRRQLTHLSVPATISTFDITPDGKFIVFDRLRDNSDIRLIDLPK